MHIVLIAWLYVTLMMAITEKTITAGVLTFVFYGLLPSAILLWLGGTASRHRARKKQALDALDTQAAHAASDKLVNQPDRANTSPDQ